MAHEEKVKRRGEPVACPDCGGPLPRPAALALGSSGERSGGCCSCGTLYLLDVTGRDGGQVLLDGLSLLCAGDLGEAMKLQDGVDYQLRSRLYNPRGHCLEPTGARRSGYGLAKLWFFRRLPAQPLS